MAYRYQRKGRKLNRYSVYNRKTGMPVMINGTARECADAMGVTLNSFRTLYTKLKKRMPRRWPSVGNREG